MALTESPYMREVVARLERFGWTRHASVGHGAGAFFESEHAREYWHAELERKLDALWADKQQSWGETKLRKPKGCLRNLQKVLLKVKNVR